MAKRVERVASAIRAIIAAAIQSDLNDPRIPAITSVTRVDVTADLALARVYVSVLAREGQRRACLHALASAAGHLRWRIGQELSLRKTPELDFRLDESVQKSFETVQLIDRAMAELGPSTEAAADGEPAPGDGNPRADCDEPTTRDPNAMWEDT